MSENTGNAESEDVRKARMDAICAAWEAEREALRARVAAFEADLCEVMRKHGALDASIAIGIPSTPDGCRDAGKYNQTASAFAKRVAESLDAAAVGVRHRADVYNKASDVMFRAAELGAVVLPCAE